MRIAFAFLSAAALVAATPPHVGYEKTASISGPDGQGWDFASVDGSTGRVFVAHGDTVAVVDARHGVAARSLGSISHSHAVVPLPHARLAVTSGHDGTVRVFDQDSGRELISIAVGENPDAAIVDPVTGHLLTMNAGEGTVSDVDLVKGKVVRTMALHPALEVPALVGRTLYVNNEDRNEVESLNLSTGRAGMAIPLKGCEGPTGIAYDASRSRLISSCANGVAAVVDLRVRAVTQLLPIGKGPDGVLLDIRRKLALVPCGGSGTLEVLSLAGREVTKLPVVTTEVGARTGAVDPATGIVYLPTARFAPAVEAGKRPQAIPGSFHLVVLKPV